MRPLMFTAFLFCQTFSSSYFLTGWVPCEGGEIPERAVAGGFDENNALFYVGRSFHKGRMRVVKICPDHHGGYILDSNNQVKFIRSYEALSDDDVIWTEASGGRLPPRAFPIGRARGGGHIYATRANVCGECTIGEFHRVHRVISTKGRRCDYFEVLAKPF